MKQYVRNTFPESYAINRVKGSFDVEVGYIKRAFKFSVYPIEVG